MLRKADNTGVPHLFWVYCGSLSNKLDACTWLETSRELSKRGWKITLVSSGSAPKHKSGNFTVLTIRRPEIYLLRHLIFHFKLLPLLARSWLSIDVLFFHSISTPMMIPLRTMRVLRGQTRPIMVMDTRDLHVPNEDIRSRLRVFFEQLMHKWANHWIDGQTAITPRMATLIGIESGKLLGTWPSGVILDDFAPAHKVRRWPDLGDGIKLIYIGALLKERNLDQICIAINQANAQGMSFDFSLVGSGDAKREILEIAGRSNGHIQLFDPVPHEQIPNLLAQAHVGVLSAFLPSEKIFQASSPIKLFEYMAAGLPILATRSACYTDVVNGGGYVFWVEQVDVPGLLAVLNVVWRNRDSLSKMGYQAADTAHAWTWQESARKLQRALEFGLATKAD